MAANQSFLDNLTGLPKLWARFDINTSTGHLIAGENGNLSFKLDANGHLISEVK